MNNLEKRMYFLVPYNISPIQQAIQAGHAALEYAYRYGNDNDYVDFIENWKTWIILNGGTTNSTRTLGDGISIGSLNQTLDSIYQFNKENPDFIIDVSYFKEPDLNDALTAISLIVDERVFNRKDYPDFREWQVDNGEEYKIEGYANDQDYQTAIKKYINSIGIDMRVFFLKELLNNKKLA